MGVAALGLALPATLLTAIDAEAQTVGMDRRQDRRPDAATVVTRDGRTSGAPRRAAWQHPRHNHDHDRKRRHGTEIGAAGFP